MDGSVAVDDLDMAVEVELATTKRKSAVAIANVNKRRKKTADTKSGKIRDLHLRNPSLC